MYNVGGVSQSGSANSSLRCEIDVLSPSSLLHPDLQFHLGVVETLENTGDRISRDTIQGGCRSLKHLCRTEAKRRGCCAGGVLLLRTTSRRPTTLGVAVAGNVTTYGDNGVSLTALATPVPAKTGLKSQLSLGNGKTAPYNRHRFIQENIIP